MNKYDQKDLKNSLELWEFRRAGLHHMNGAYATIKNLKQYKTKVTYDLILGNDIENEKHEYNLTTLSIERVRDLMKR